LTTLVLGIADTVFCTLFNIVVASEKATKEASLSFNLLRKGFIAIVKRLKPSETLSKLTSFIFEILLTLFPSLLSDVAVLSKRDTSIALRAFTALSNIGVNLIN